jgi:hypothetical protein
MDMAAGLLLVYLKLFGVALVIMGGIWALVKVVEKRGKK